MFIATALDLASRDVLLIYDICRYRVLFPISTLIIQYRALGKPFCSRAADFDRSSQRPLQACDGCLIWHHSRGGLSWASDVVLRGFWAVPSGLAGSFLRRFSSKLLFVII